MDRHGDRRFSARQILFVACLLAMAGGFLLWLAHFGSDLVAVPPGVLPAGQEAVVLMTVWMVAEVIGWLAIFAAIALGGYLVFRGWRQRR